MDSDLRQIERAAASDPAARQQFVRLLQRAGHHPYWLRVREVTCPKDNIYHDEEVKEHQPHLPRWEERGPSVDRRWVFYLHIPIDETEMVVWLGEMTCTESDNGAYLIGQVETLENRYLWDTWIRREGVSKEEFVRGNWAVADALKSSGGSQSRLYFTTDVPLGWTPAEEIEIAASQIDPHLLRRIDAPPLPPHDFLVEDHLFNIFYEWLQNTQTEYGSRLRRACCPLDYQLATVYQERHIWLHYWKGWDSSREIIAKSGDYHPSRIAYDVSYRVSWCWDYSARFYRWGGQPGDDNSGEHINALSACEVVHMDKSEQEHLDGQRLAQQRAFDALQKKLKSMIEVATFWRYNVILEEVSLPYVGRQVRGCPCHSQMGDPYRSTWMAGMTIPDELGPIRGSWGRPI